MTDTFEKQIQTTGSKTRKKQGPEENTPPSYSRALVARSQQPLSELRKENAQLPVR